MPDLPILLLSGKADAATEWLGRPIVSRVVVLAEEDAAAFEPTLVRVTVANPWFEPSGPEFTLQGFLEARPHPAFGLLRVGTSNQIAALLPEGFAGTVIVVAHLADADACALLEPLVMRLIGEGVRPVVVAGWPADSPARSRLAIAGCIDALARMPVATFVVRAAPGADGVRPLAELTAWLSAEADGGPRASRFAAAAADPLLDRIGTAGLAALAEEAPPAAQPSRDGLWRVLMLKSATPADREPVLSAVKGVIPPPPVSAGVPSVPRPQPVEASKATSVDEPRGRPFGLPDSRRGPSPDRGGGAVPQPAETVVPPAAAPIVDIVSFTVTTPPSVKPAESFLLDLWAHTGDQREEVLRRAREQSPDGIAARTQGPVRLARGSLLSARLDLPAMSVQDPDCLIGWEGEIGNASWAVSVPADIDRDRTLGSITIRSEGLPIATVRFELRIGATTRTAAIDSATTHFHKAFASYASRDRYEVLGRIHGMQKTAPDLDVFVDVMSLRSGQDWAAALERRIGESDVFYLFWSANARDSEWVEREWRCALAKRGIDFIDPVPLVPPDRVPPPAELASRHFNDAILAFLQQAAD